MAVRVKLIANSPQVYQTFYSGKPVTNWPQTIHMTGHKLNQKKIIFIKLAKALTVFGQSFNSSWSQT